MTHYPDWSVTDQYDSQSEGLAAKLEDANQPHGIARLTSKRKAEDSSEPDSDDEEDGNQTHTENGRRVRARSLIDDEQLAVLKGYYAINPRPKKEEIIMIANYINFPTRVVQVKAYLYLMYICLSLLFLYIYLSFNFLFSLNSYCHFFRYGSKTLVPEIAENRRSQRYYLFQIQLTKLR